MKSRALASFSAHWSASWDRTRDKINGKLTIYQISTKRLPSVINNKITFIHCSFYNKKISNKYVIIR